MCLQSSALSKLQEVPRISLYREALKKKDQQKKITIKTPKRTNTPTLASKRSSSANTGIKNDPSHILQSTKKTDPKLNIRSPLSNVGKTYTVFKASFSPSRDDIDCIKVDKDGTGCVSIVEHNIHHQSGRVVRTDTENQAGEDMQDGDTQHGNLICFVLNKYAMFS